MRGLLALATFCVYRLREPSSIEHAITYSLLALTLSFLLFLAGGFQYSAGFYVGRFFVAAGSFVVLTTALRDFRDNFAPELWAALGVRHAAALLTASELPVAVLSLTVLGVIIVVKDNARALMVIHAVVALGLGLLGASTLLYQSHWLSPIAWMILSGAGLYMAYVPFNAMLFDRLIAVSGTVGTAGFLIYIADASGYVGSCSLLIWRNFGLVELNWLQVFIASAYGTSLVGIVLVIFSAVFFLRKARGPAARRQPNSRTTPA